MRELTLHETSAVSGGGVIKDVATAIGQQAGSFIGTALAGLIPIPVFTGFYAKAVGSLTGNIGGWLGSLIGGLLEPNTSSSTDAS